MTIDPVVDAWLGTLRLSPGTIREYTHDLREFSKWLSKQEVSVDDVTQDDLARYSLHLDQTDLSASTTHRRRMTVKLLYGWMYEKSRIESNPGRLYDKAVGPQIARREVMSVADLRRIIATAKDPKDRAVLLLMTVMGLALREVCALQISDLLADAGGWLLRVDGRQRELPIPSVVAEPLLSVRGTRTRGPLLVNQRNRPLEQAAIARIVGRVAEQTNLGYSVSSRLLINSMRGALIVNPVPMHTMMQGLGSTGRHFLSQAGMMPTARTHLTYHAAALVRDDPHSTEGLFDAASAFSDNDRLPAASTVMLCGAAFEQHLRELAINAQVLDPSERRTTITGLAGQLRGGGVITNAEVQSCATIAEVRDQAAHGWFDLVTHDLADRVIGFMRQIVRAHPLPS